MDSAGTTNATPVGFKSHVRAERLPGGAAFLISERGTTRLSGKSADLLVPLLDGTRSLVEIVREVSAELPAGQVGQVLGRLASANLIGHRPPARTRGGDTAAEAYWDLAGLDGANVTRRAADRVEVVALGHTDAAAAAAACRASGLTVTVTEAGAGDRAGSGDEITGRVEDEAAAFSLVLCADYLDEELAEVNARRLADGRPWLLAKPVGADPWVGPVFRPGAGPCWACLATRLRGRRQASSVVPAGGDGTDPIRPPEASLPASRGLGLQMAILETAKWLGGIRHAAQDAVWTLDTIELSDRHHPVRRRPQCPVCGNPGLVARQGRRPVAPRARPKAAEQTGNGHRALSAKQLLRRYGHLIDPLTGIVADIRRDERAPAPLHCYVSGQNAAVAAAIPAGLRTQTGGKGRTELDAKVSALCEAVERYCGSRLGDEPTVRGSLRELATVAVHPNSCQLFHPRQFRDRTRWNATCAPFQRVPAPFPEDEAIDWTPVWSLTERRHRLLPTQMLYFDAHATDERSYVWADSNGNAAGGSLEDAIVHGFLELVERDAVALWWYNRTGQRQVCLDSFDDDWIHRLREAYARVHREFWVLDLTADLPIPVMAAISRRTDKPAEDIMLGFGAHFDPRVALSRALTEMGQLLPAVIDVGRGSGDYGSTGPHLREWWTRATVRSQPYLLPDPDRPVRGVGDYPSDDRADLGDDIRHSCRLAAERGLDILVLDQTRPDIGLPVVKVIVPGLRHFWARFAPGRLYDVPVRLGRLAAPTAYEDLNPIPLFL
jgi:ribosomal protein S12 methylthiotransferase accessory factor